MSWSFHNPISPVLSLIVILLIVFGAIIISRLYLKRPQVLAKRNRQQSIRKYRQYQVLKSRGRSFGLGLFLSCLFVYLCLNWTLLAKPIQQVELVDIYYGDIIAMEDPPRTPSVKKEIPKPDPIRFNVIEGDPIKPDTIVALITPPVPVGVTMGRVINEPAAQKAVPKFEPPKRDVEKIFKIVEEEPYFGVCELNDKTKQKQCANEPLFAYLGEHLNYPRIALENGISGRVIISFVVEKDGSISSAKILRGIGGGCDEEALRVVNDMPKWTPGKQRGRAVRVQFTLPVSFTLH